jgi:hypothetical protein
LITSYTKTDEGSCTCLPENSMPHSLFSLFGSVKGTPVTPAPNDANDEISFVGIVVEFLIKPGRNLHCLSIFHKGVHGGYALWEFQLFS